MDGADASIVPLQTCATWFQRFLLPGLAFKAVVIGGGYATGRELAEFFLPAGPWGGIAAMLLVACVWSSVCALTFAFALATGSFDYRTFFKQLLGPGWIVFEAAYLLFVVLILSVFGASAGAIGQALFGWPTIDGTLLLGGTIALVTAFGTGSVERLFKWVSVLLYAVYALFLLLALARFSPTIAVSFALPASGQPWVPNGLAYASYNVVGAVIILPVLRHLTSRRDAVVAGIIAGPLALVPALAFFIAMMAFYPGIGAAALPSNVILAALDLPAFRIVFQTMIFAALLESGSGATHAINERVAAAWHARRGGELSAVARAAIAVGALAVSMILAEWIGLVALIAHGYRLLSYVIFAVFIVPLATIGVRRLCAR